MCNSSLAMAMSQPTPRYRAIPPGSGVGFSFSALWFAKITNMLIMRDLRLTPRSRTR